MVQMARRGVPCAEVNLDTSGATDICDFVFQACYPAGLGRAHHMAVSAYACPAGSKQP